jgi:hypothetical protein
MNQNDSRAQFASLLLNNVRGISLRKDCYKVFCEVAKKTRPDDTESIAIYELISIMSRPKQRL